MVALSLVLAKPCEGAGGHISQLDSLEVFLG
jgi:hypothetical protein